MRHNTVIGHQKFIGKHVNVQGMNKSLLLESEINPGAFGDGSPFLHEAGNANISVLDLQDIAEGTHHPAHLCEGVDTYQADSGPGVKKSKCAGVLCMTASGSSLGTPVPVPHSTK